MMTNANTQARAGRGGVVPPKERQFGQPNGNKQGRGFWKKEDTARYKLEQMMKLNNAELLSVAQNDATPVFERKLAYCLANGSWKEINDMINQVYGYPKQQIEQHNIEVKPIAPKPKKEKK